MSAVLISLVVAVGMLLGARLRYSPFREAVTSRQRRIMLIAHLILGILNIVFILAAFAFMEEKATILIVRISNIGFAAASVLVNALVIRKWIQEQMFVLGLVLTFNYMLMSVSDFISLLLPSFGSMTDFLVLESIYLAVLLAAHIPLYNMLYDTVAPFLKLDIGKYWNTIWFIPLAFFSARFIGQVGIDYTYTNRIPQMIGNLLATVVMILICKSVAADPERMRERQQFERQLADQKLHYAELKVRVEDARKTKHDFKHHIASIHHYIDIDDKEGLRSYCNDLLERSTEEDKIPYTGNAAADGVFFHYMKLAKEHNTVFRYSGTICTRGIADVDICALLGNALDNALAGCRTISDGRCIDVICQSEKQLLSVVIHNTFDGRVESSEKGILSRKRQNRRGVGLSSMRSVCDRYGGSMEAKWDEGSFTVMFMLPLSEDE